MRKRKDFVRLEGIRSARLVVIASEGRCTEAIYFTEAKNKLSAPNVHVEVLNRDSNESSPESVHNQIADFMREYNIRPKCRKRVPARQRLGQLKTNLGLSDSSEVCFAIKLH